MTSLVTIPAESAPPTMAEDLGLIGLRLVHDCQEHDHVACGLLDLRFDVDAIAVGQSGRTYLVSYRTQPEYDYQTITIRWMSDSGNADVQGQKILDGRSKADVFVQGYPSGVAFSMAPAIQTSLRMDPDCSDHEKLLRGRSGQLLRVLCARCCDGIRYTARAPLLRITTGAATSALADLQSPEFEAAWRAGERTA